MPINTLEDALAEFGSKLPAAASEARQALAKGADYTITVVLKPSKRGAVASMHGQSSADRRSFGQLIRLN